MTTRPTSGRLRTIGALVAGALAVLAAALAPAGVYAERVLFASEPFAEAIAPLRSDAGMQDVILTAVGEQADRYIDQLSQDSGPLSGLVDQAKPWLASAVESSMRRTMASDAYAREWDAAVRQTHANVMAVLSGTAPSTGMIVFPAGKLADLVAQDAMSNLPFDVTVPHMSVDIPILSAQSVARYQGLYAVVDQYGYVPLIVAVLAGALAIALSHKRMRTAAILALAVALVAVVGGLVVSFVPQQFAPAAQVPTDVAARGVHLLLEPLATAQWILAGAAALIGAAALVIPKVRSRHGGDTTSIGHPATAETATAQSTTEEHQCPVRT